jgi:hypothetical protein
MSGARFTLWWVGRYTRGLPDDVRARRLDEITSDLWEHAAAGGGRAIRLAVLSRCVRGMAADLAWRSAHRRRRRPSARAALLVVGGSIALLAYLFLFGVYAFLSLPVVGIEPYGDDWAPGDVTLYSRIGFLLLVLLALGGVLLPRRPGIGLALLSAAVVGACAAFWWAAPVYGAVGAAALSGALGYTRRRRPRVRS